VYGSNDDCAGAAGRDGRMRHYDHEGERHYKRRKGRPEQPSDTLERTAGILRERMRRGIWPKTATFSLKEAPLAI
jgi:hypothetical protein